MKAIALIAASAFLPAATAQVIDFETTHTGGTPTDNGLLPVTAQFNAGGVNVSFGFDTNGDLVADRAAVYERRGADGSDGFFSTQGPGTHDTERPTSTSSLGDFFLRQPSSIGSVPGDFLITYDRDVIALSGEIWDLDAGSPGTNFEQWRISALDASGAVLAFIDTPRGLGTADPAGLDSLPFFFSFSGIGNIRQVRFEFTGTANNVGLAFDNYNARFIPAPAGAAAGLALVPLALRRRRG